MDFSGSFKSGFKEELYLSIAVDNFISRPMVKETRLGTSDVVAAFEETEVLQFLALLMLLYPMRYDWPLQLCHIRLKGKYGFWRQTRAEYDFLLNFRAE